MSTFEKFPNTTVVNVHHGDEYDVYIGRGSKWGNPFKLRSGATLEERHRVISQYMGWVVNQPQLIKAMVKELAGKRLGCYCAPLPCHGDMLVGLINGLIQDAREKYAAQQAAKHAEEPLPRHQHTEV